MTIKGKPCPNCGGQTTLASSTVVTPIDNGFHGTETRHVFLECTRCDWVLNVTEFLRQAKPVEH